jgi:hypothetical protein
MRLLAGTLSLGVLALGCAGAPVLDEKGTGADGKGDSSVEATFLNFEFDGELVSSSSWAGAKSLVQDQLLYTIGHLNEQRSVGRLDRLELTNLVSEPIDGGLTRVKYHAKLPVAWGSKTNLPTSYEFSLPRNVSSDALQTFTTKYVHDCVDFGAHDVDAGSMWYYYRPERSGCALAAEDIVKASAAVTLSPNNTTGMYPEYAKVWEDSAFNVVAIFGKYEDGGSSSDVGVQGYNNFAKAMKTALSGLSLKTTPEVVPDAPGTALADITFEGTLAGGKKVSVTALLVDNVSSAPAAFYTRYEALSTRADLIMYNGHAGLGQNVRALARRGKFVAGQYAIVFMNGCDTYAYVDGSLAEARARLNPDDPTGTKYMEFVTNAMPSFFHSMPNASMALIKGLMKFDAPLTYEQIFTGIDRSQVVLVTGEEDNVFRPTVTPGGFTGLKESGSVSRNEELRYETVQLAPGDYIVKIANDPAAPGGDADLYVRKGETPTKTVYDCRPYKSGSVEECRVKITTPVKLHISVIGYANRESAYVLTADPDVSR